jgi:hypothetical protein
MFGADAVYIRADAHDGRHKPEQLVLLVKVSEAKLGI